MTTEQRNRLETFASLASDKSAMRDSIRAALDEITRLEQASYRVTDEYRAVVKDRNSEAARAEELAAIVKRQAEELALLHRVETGCVVRYWLPDAADALAQWHEKYGSKQ